MGAIIWQKSYKNVFFCRRHGARPFLGSGTTVKVALELNRNAIGKEKLGIKGRLLTRFDVKILKQAEKKKHKIVNYEPQIKDAKPLVDLNKLTFKKETFYKVAEIVDENAIKLDTELLVKFLGVEVINKEETIRYLNNCVLKGK